MNPHRRRRAAHTTRPSHPRRAAADPTFAEEAERILIGLEHPCSDPTSCEVDQICQAYSEDLVDDFPDVDRALLGAVAIHIAGTLGIVIEHLRKTLPVDADPTAAAVNTLAGAGARMYLGAIGRDPSTLTTEG